jgi:hypothetical protein
MSQTQEIIDLLQARASSGRDAFSISRVLFDDIITILRKRFGISYHEAELLLIGVIRKHEDTLFELRHEHLHLDDASAAVRICLDGES